MSCKDSRKSVGNGNCTACSIGKMTSSTFGSHFSVFWEDPLVNDGITTLMAEFNDIESRKV